MYLAEQNVIGSLLMDQKAIDGVYGSLKPEMFRDELLKAVYVEFLRASDNGYDLGPSQIIQRVSGDSFPADVVHQAIMGCVNETVTSATIKGHAQVIVNEYRAAVFGEIINKARPKAADIDRQLGEMINELESLRKGTTSQPKAIRQIVEENKARYFIPADTENTYTGFPKLDGLLGGLEGGDMIVIGGRPGTGKSAFATQIISYMAKCKKRVGFYNLEMQEKQVYERLLSIHSGIDLTRIRRAKQFLGGEKKDFEQANSQMETFDIFVGSGPKSVGEIRNESRNMGYDCIVIDYMQLLKDDGHHQSRAAEVGAISRAIKSLAMELKIPVIALSQLNRASEMRSEKEPTMAELREAGDIEQDASIIILMWSLPDDGSGRSNKGVKVEKNRQGETGKMVLRFVGNRMVFAETEENVDKWRKAEESTPFD